MIRSQGRLVELLALVLVVALIVFHLDWFLHHSAMVWVFKALVLFSVIWLSTWFSRVLGVRVWGLLGVFIVVEAGAWLYANRLVQGRRYSAPGFAFMRNMADDWHRNIFQYDQSLSQYDPELFYTLRPNLRAGTYKGWEFTTKIDANSAGLRDDEASLRDPSVVFLGDSFTVGWGVDDTACFTSQLERLLACKTLNAGMSSFGTVRETELLKRLDLDSCRLLIVQYCANDDYENKMYQQANFHLLSSGREVYDRYVRYNDVTGQYFPFKFLYSALRTVVMPWERAWTARRAAHVAATSAASVAAAATPTDIFFQILRHLRRYYRGPVLVTHIEAVGTGPEIIRDFESHLKANPMPGVYLADMSDVLRSADYFAFDNHIIPEGHRKVAQRLNEVIRRHRLLEKVDVPLPPQ